MYMCIYVYVCVSVCIGPRPRRLTLKSSAGCYYLSITKEQHLYISEAARRRVIFRPVGQKSNRKTETVSVTDRLQTKNT